jgi:dCMP deaminase
MFFTDEELSGAKYAFYTVESVDKVASLQEVNWDSYYMSVAEIVAQQSKCLSRKVGAIAVKEKVIICTGYNGPARGIPHCETRNEPPQKECPRKVLGYKSGEGLHMCLASHAEMSLVAQAARLGISLTGAKVYIYAGVYPCSTCTGIMINAGINEVIVPNYAKPYDDLALYQLENSRHLSLRTIQYISKLKD